VLETALQKACTLSPAARGIWTEPLHRVEEKEISPASPASLISRLSAPDWVERFAVRQALAKRGGEAAAPLVAIRQSDGDLQTLAVWLLKSIAEETTSRLKKRASSLLCSHHLVHPHSHKVRLSWRSVISYYGCRACGQSREFLEWSGKVTAMLDAGMAHEQVEDGGVLRVNWSVRQSLFDFDEVEILRATDEDVERFAVQVGNDTDKVRQRRYKKMHCVIAPGCQLSENTLRILRSRFGRVEHHA
jgi:hypothetical protein